MTDGDFFWQAPSGTMYIKTAWPLQPGSVVECEGEEYRVMKYAYTVEDEETAFGQHWYEVTEKVSER